MNIDLDNKTQRYLGLDEKEIQRKFKQYAIATDVFVDIGSSDGYYGLIYHKWNREGTQYLCDARQAFAQEQKDNFILNSYDTVKIHFVSKFIAGISNEESVALDELLKDVDGDIFLKIDVDGGELNVLQGVVNTLRERQCMLIVETHSKELEVGCTNYLDQLGYTTQIIRNAWWRRFIPELRPIAHNRWFSAEKK